MFSNKLIEYYVSVEGCADYGRAFKKLKDARRYKKQLKNELFVKARITRREFDGGKIPFILSERMVW